MLTFVFTDIEGSTRLWQDFPDQMRVALPRHDQLLCQTIQAHNGHLAKMTGDGALAAFASAADALTAALAVQQALHTEPWPPETALQIRIGLHCGEADSREGDYFGETVNRTARLMSIAHGGQMIISQAVCDLMREALPSGISLRDLAAHRLKDLQQPEHVWQVCHPDLPADFPPLRSLQAFPNNLPTQINSFVGRHQEMEAVKALLSVHRLVTLTGAGGAGKTRLSLQVAADLLEQHEDGIFFVEMAALSDSSLLPQAIASAVGVREEPGRALLETLSGYLRTKRLLLLLDNCEHLVNAAANLTQTLLQSCPSLQVLATSREALNVPGEKIWRVPSLAGPDAMRLFVERARLHGEFVLNRGNSEAVTQVCSRLDGIPLALELAAARVKMLSPAQIASRLDDRFRLLTGGSRTALPRQQTLRALIDWSYDLLTEPERLLLARLSVFGGGWTVEAAEAVCVADDIAEFELLDLLSRLADKSLVQVEDADSEVRYRLLESLREYSQGKLGQSGQTEPWRARHRDYFLAFAEEAETQLRGSEQAAWLCRLETEHDNLRAALRWCETELENEDKDAAAWLRLCVALTRFWEVRGFFSEGRHWLGRVLSRTKGKQVSTALAQALHGAGILAWGQGDYGAAHTLYAESLHLFRQFGDQEGIAKSLNMLGIAAQNQGDDGAARTFYEESLDIKRQIGDQWGMANSLNNLGLLVSQQGDYEAAHTLIEESLYLYRHLRNQQGIATALHNLGEVAHNLGDDGAAQTLYAECLAIARQLGFQQGIAISLHSLGNLAFERSDRKAAYTFFEESLDITRQIGDEQGIADLLERLANVLVSDGQAARGAHLWGAADTLRKIIGAPLSPLEREQQEKEKAQARQELGEEAFSAAFAAGQALTWAQAVAEALEKRLP